MRTDMESATEIKCVESARTSSRRSDESTPSGRLFIPYFDGDNGARPLGNSWPFYMCPGITVNGVPYDGTKLTPGDTLRLAVKVVNGGNKRVDAFTTRLSWAQPSLGFFRDQLTIIGEVKNRQKIHAGRSLIGIETAWVITDDVPEHVCLIAEVSQPQQVTPAEFDVTKDSQFSQQNLQLKSVKAGEVITIQFNAAISTENFARAQIVVRQPQGHIVEMLAQVVKRQPARTQLTDFNIRSFGAVSPGKRTDGGDRASLWELQFQVPTDVRSGEFLPIEVLLLQGTEREGEEVRLQQTRGHFDHGVRSKDQDGNIMGGIAVVAVAR